MELENKIKCVLMDFEINEITLQEATQRILHLFNVSKRFNFPNFIAGVMVGILICTIIVELAF